MSRQRKKGTAYETIVRMFLAARSIFFVRQPLHGSRDEGDLHGEVRGLRVVIECKNVRDAGPALVDEWRRQTLAERENAGADAAALVRHLPGNGEKRRGLDEVHMTMADAKRLLDDDVWVVVRLEDAASSWEAM